MKAESIALQLQQAEAVYFGGRGQPDTVFRDAYMRVFGKTFRLSLKPYARHLAAVRAITQGYGIDEVAYMELNMRLGGEAHRVFTPNLLTTDTALRRWNDSQATGSARRGLAMRGGESDRVVARLQVAEEDTADVVLALALQGQTYAKGTDVPTDQATKVARLRALVNAVDRLESGLSRRLVLSAPSWALFSEWACAYLAGSGRVLRVSVPEDIDTNTQGLRSAIRL